MALPGPFVATGKLTSHDLPGHSEIHQGLGPYGPGCSYATVQIKGMVDVHKILSELVIPIWSMLTKWELTM